MPHFQRIGVNRHERRPIHLPELQGRKGSKAGRKEMIQICHLCGKDNGKIYSHGKAKWWCISCWLNNAPPVEDKIAP